MFKVLEGYAISQRRACVLIGVDPKTVRRERPPDHGAIRVAMREVAGKRRRFGYRRIGVMLERQGLIMNHKKLDTSKNRVILASSVRTGHAGLTSYGF